jgi:membrane protease YdiL (CAAX protease family)
VYIRAYMSSESQFRAELDTILKRHPVLAYFALTFALSWIGALAVAAPHFVRQQPLPRITGIRMFPVMLLGPSCAGVLLRRLVDGKSGLRALFSQMFRASVSARWYAALLVPPTLVLVVLLFLEGFVSSVYAPNGFLLGILFAIPAGFFEEIGWTGYAFPKMRSQNDALAPSILLGLLWGLWHFPVIDFLGTASPHGVYLLPFFCAFTVAMTAMRVLIAWIYTNTRSILLAQLMHVSSTGSLVLFSPLAVTAAQEVMWYAVYGIVLWLAVAIVVKTLGRSLTQQRAYEDHGD